MKAVGEQPTYHKYASLSSVCERKGGANIIYASIVFMNGGHKPNMMLI